MTKDHGSSVKNDKQYEGLRRKGMSKGRAAAIANSPGSSSRGGKKSHSGGRSTTSSKAGELGPRKPRPGARAAESPGSSKAGTQQGGRARYHLRAGPCLQTAIYMKESKCQASEK